MRSPCALAWSFAMTSDALLAHGSTVSDTISATVVSGSRVANAPNRGSSAKGVVAATNSAALHVRTPSSMSGSSCTGPALRVSPPERTSRKKSWWSGGSGRPNGIAIGWSCNASTGISDDGSVPMRMTRSARSRGTTVPSNSSRAATITGHIQCARSSTCSCSSVPNSASR